MPRSLAVESDRSIRPDREDTSRQPEPSYLSARAQGGALIAYQLVEQCRRWISREIGKHASIMCSILAHVPIPLTDGRCSSEGLIRSPETRAETSSYWVVRPDSRKRRSSLSHRVSLRRLLRVPSSTASTAQLLPRSIVNPFSLSRTSHSYLINLSRFPTQSSRRLHASVSRLHLSRRLRHRSTLQVPLEVARIVRPTELSSFASTEDHPPRHGSSRMRRGLEVGRRYRNVSWTGRDRKRRSRTNSLDGFSGRWKRAGINDRRCAASGPSCVPNRTASVSGYNVPTRR